MIAPLSVLVSQLADTASGLLMWRRVGPSAEANPLARLLVDDPAAALLVKLLLVVLVLSAAYVADQYRPGSTGRRVRLVAVGAGVVGAGSNLWVLGL